jgi:dTMP kinase
MFVAIDGLDGVGKTTLVKELAWHYGGVEMYTPGPGLRPVVDTVLASLGDHQTARCLFYAASVLAAGRKARELADTGQFVFMDRYWLSTIAYARARGVSVDLSALESIVPAPDLTVLLTMDEEERQRRLTNRAVTAEDMETFDFQFRETVLCEMRGMARLPALRPVGVDVTGSDALRRVIAVMTRTARIAENSQQARTTQLGPESKQE